MKDRSRRLNIEHRLAGLWRSVTKKAIIALLLIQCFVLIPYIVFVIKVTGFSLPSLKYYLHLVNAAGGKQAGQHFIGYLVFLVPALLMAAVLPRVLSRYYVPIISLIPFPNVLFDPIDKNDCGTRPNSALMMWSLRSYTNETPEYNFESKIAFLGLEPLAILRGGRDPSESTKRRVVRVAVSIFFIIEVPIYLGGIFGLTYYSQCVIQQSLGFNFVLEILVSAMLALLTYYHALIAFKVTVFIAACCKYMTDKWPWEVQADRTT